MGIDSKILGRAGKIGMELCELYRSFGYLQYKMSKFEEYDLYARNKEFLISDSVLTFTDLSGKLMALKPDVTLSIVRNTRDDVSGAQKVYYTENVYRAGKGSNSYKEILQAGLECIGEIDDYLLSETLILAVQSLIKISEQFRLVISDLDIIRELIAALHVSEEYRPEILRCISGKNMHELKSICTAACADADASAVLCRALESDGSPVDMIASLEALGCAPAAVAHLKNILAALAAVGLDRNLRLDLSIVSDMNYYNGLVFKGYVDGVPTSVLSGGQYDRLMEKMGRRVGAVGFAVYLDALEQLFDDTQEYDVDIVLMYDASTDLRILSNAVLNLTACGLRISAQTERPEKLRYRQLCTLKENEVVVLENNA